MKHSITKQEDIVCALWDFARQQAGRTLDAKARGLDGTEVDVNLQAVGEALDRILKTFGYEPVEIQ